MRKLCTALLFYLGLASAVLAQQAVVVPATMFSIPVVGAIGTTLLVTGQPSKSIYVTAIDIVPAAAGASVTFIQGTGGTCAGGPTGFLTGVMVFSAGQIYLKGDGFGTFWVLTPGNSLCVIIAAQIAPGSLAYAIF